MCQREERVPGVVVLRVRQDGVEEILPGWQIASQAVSQELADWRRAPPTRTPTRPGSPDNHRAHPTLIVAFSVALA
jgi:hypothetical protein